MSNQRPGKTHKAAAGDGLQDMKLRNFFRSCREILNAEGNDDAAFWFEQIEEHINNGGRLPDSRAEIARMLGV